MAEIVKVVVDPMEVDSKQPGHLKKGKHTIIYKEENGGVKINYLKDIQRLLNYCVSDFQDYNTT